MEYSKLKKAFLVNYVKSADLWEEANKVDFEEDAPETIEYYEQLKTVDAMKIACILHEDTDIYTISINGFSEDVDHYEIDDAMEAIYGEWYKGDSESGCFFGFCVPGIKDVVADELKERFPGLKFSMKDAKETIMEPGFKAGDYVSCIIPGANNWTVARETLKGLA